MSVQNKVFRFLPAILFLSLLGGCLKDMHLVEFKTGDSAKGFWDTNKGEIRVYLEDGNILRGPYSTVSNARFSIGTPVHIYRGHVGVGVYPRVGFSGRGNIYALLEDDDSHLVMEIVADVNKWSGSGHGEARTNDGRVYKVIF